MRVKSGEWRVESGEWRVKLWSGFAAIIFGSALKDVQEMRPSEVL